MGRADLTASARVDRRFIRIGDRYTLYRRSGSGSPIILIHPGMASSIVMVPMMARFSDRHTCFAFDNPGLGCSDPLAVKDVSMADCADALAAAMRALGFPPVPVFGSHTGGAIAVELSVRHPDLVSGIIVDGLPMFTADEVRALYSEDYAPPLVPDRLGGHFASTWTRFRDQGTSYPWYSRDPAHLLPAETGISAERVHNAITGFFRAADTYAGPFLAAHVFGEIAAARLAAVETPAVFMVASNDNLIRHINRFPRLKANQALIRLGPDPEERIALIAESLARFDTGAAAPADPAPSISNTGIDRHFVDLPAGQMMVRSSGPADAPPLLLIHDAPGSGLVLEPLMAALGLHYRVHAPDLPGSGESDALALDAPSLADYVAALMPVIHQLGPEHGAAGLTVHGIGFGASLAIALAEAAPERVTHLVLRGVPLPSAEQRRDMRLHYAPPITIDQTGGHWYRLWLMLRDSLVYFPWYDRSLGAQRRVPGDFSAGRLHRWTCEVMKQGHAYHHLIEAALDHDAGAALGRIETPVLVLDDQGHPFAAFAPGLDAACPSATRLPAPEHPFDQAEAIATWQAR